MQIMEYNWINDSAVLGTYIYSGGQIDGTYIVGHYTGIYRQITVLLSVCAHVLTGVSQTQRDIQTVGNTVV